MKKSDGSYVEDENWPGEFFFDTKTAAKRTALANIINPWISGCKKSGFAAVEPDNLDTFTRQNSGLSLTNNLAFIQLLANHSHSIGLAIGQKNTGSDLGIKGRDIGHLDFAIAEECHYYAECDTYTKPYGNHVIEIEYTDDGNYESNMKGACKDLGTKISILFRDRNVVPKGQKGYFYKTCPK